jgi:hypothetical protein
MPARLSIQVYFFNVPEPRKVGEIRLTRTRSRRERVDGLVDGISVRKGETPKAGWQSRRDLPCELAMKDIGRGLGDPEPLRREVGHGGLRQESTSYSTVS